MCSIFGTNIKDIDKLKKLAIEGEVRGTDATGIASIDSETIQITKSDVKASQLDYDNINLGNFFLGHTRKTTQGKEGNNENNHPFISQDNTLLLAHNGIIYNDKELWTYDTDIETDSFVVMQQLEKVKEDNMGLTIDNVKTVCEKLRGSFTLTILDTYTNTLFLLRHSNPLKIMYNAETGELVYASLTKMIRKAYGEETDFGTFIGETQEDLIYEFDLDTNTFVNQREFSPKTYNKTTRTRNYNYWSKTGNRIKNFFDDVKEKFDLKKLFSYHFELTKKSKSAYSISHYDKCDFCGIYYKNDSYVKAGLEKNGKHFCAFCWEGEQETVYKHHKISDEQLNQAQQKKKEIQEKEEEEEKELLLEESNTPKMSLNENQYQKLKTELQMQYTFCSSCKQYFYDNYDMVFYDNETKTYKCELCLAEETHSSKTKVN